MLVFAASFVDVDADVDVVVVDETDEMDEDEEVASELNNDFHLNYY
jgi:hypothetical protein